MTKGNGKKFKVQTGGKFEIKEESKKVAESESNSDLETFFAKPPGETSKSSLAQKVMATMEKRFAEMKDEVLKMLQDVDQSPPSPPYHPSSPFSVLRKSPSPPPQSASSPPHSDPMETTVPNPSTLSDSKATVPFIPLFFPLTEQEQDPDIILADILKDFMNSSEFAASRPAPQPAQPTSSQPPKGRRFKVSARKTTKKPSKKKI